MRRCPHCAFDLEAPVVRYERRRTAGLGGRTPGSEYVFCPECAGLIDGFSNH